MKIISLGWGVQSFTLAAMAALGDIEKPDAIIHADTTHERHVTYRFAEKWTPWLVQNGLRVVTVTPKPSEINIGQKGWVDMPVFTLQSGKKGQLRRQCTGHWKIAPIRRWLQVNRNRQTVEMWIGISLDEYQRMRDSDVKYIVHRYPLVDLKMTRNDCINYLRTHDLEVPARSACVFCPYQSSSDWTTLKAGDNGDFEKAVEIDKFVRQVRLPGELFVHPARKPLSEVDFGDKQKSLFDQECEGICGV